MDQKMDYKMDQKTHIYHSGVQMCIDAKHRIVVLSGLPATVGICLERFCARGNGLYPAHHKVEKLFKRTQLEMFQDVENAFTGTLKQKIEDKEMFSLDAPIETVLPPRWNHSDDLQFLCHQENLIMDGKLFCLACNEIDIKTFRDVISEKMLKINMALKHHAGVVKSYNKGADKKRSEICNSYEMIKLLIQSGADCGHDNVVENLLITTILAKDTIFTEWLFRHAYNIRKSDRLLNLIVREGTIDMIHDLFRRGVRINNDQNHTPLHFCQTLEMMKFLFDNGAIASDREYRGKDLLQHHVEKDRLAIAAFLIDEKKLDYKSVSASLGKLLANDIDIPDEVFQFCIEHGGDVNCIGHHDRPALNQYVTQKRPISRIRALIDAKADVNVPNPVVGTTNLYYSIVYSNLELFQLLLQAGATWESASLDRDRDRKVQADYDLRDQAAIIFGDIKQTSLFLPHIKPDDLAKLVASRPHMNSDVYPILMARSRTDYAALANYLDDDVVGLVLCYLIGDRLFSYEEYIDREGLRK